MPLLNIHLMWHAVPTKQWPMLKEDIRLELWVQKVVYDVHLSRRERNR